jgi:ABC-type transport system involved in Fe-S cluster assembly fused permease/ATPase subunit
VLLQAAGRRVAFYTFAHVLGLDLQFHLDRKTGAVLGSTT